MRTGSFDARHTFTDQEKDEENGLMYYGARYYNPRIGRFTQSDPVIIDTSRKEFAVGMANPQLLNPYAYAGNNPLKYTDENGEFVFLPIIAPVYAAPYAAGLIATGFVGLAYATKYYAEALGHYSEGDNASAEASIANEMVAVQTTAAGGMAIMALDKAVSGGSGANANAQQSNNTNTTQQIQGTKTSLPDSALCVRGGQCTAEQFRNASGVKYNERTNMIEDGVSVNSAPNKSVEELSKGIKNGQVGVTTVRDVRRAGGNVIPSQTSQSPNHATLKGVTPEQAQKLFQPTKPNPARIKRK